MSHILSPRQVYQDLDVKAQESYKWKHLLAVGERVCLFKIPIHMRNVIWYLVYMAFPGQMFI